MNPQALRQPLDRLLHAILRNRQIARERGPERFDLARRVLVDLLSRQFEHSVPGAALSHAVTQRLTELDPWARPSTTAEKVDLPDLGHKLIANFVEDVTKQECLRAPYTPEEIEQRVWLRLALCLVVPESLPTRLSESARKAVWKGAGYRTRKAWML